MCVPPFRRRALAGVVLLALVPVAAASAAPAAAETVFRFSPAQIAIPLIVGAAAAAVAVLSRRYEWGLRITAPAVLISVLAILLFAPCMAMDRVTVTPTRIEQSTGFWFAPTVKGFAYQEVQTVRVGVGRVGRRQEMIWYVHRKDGSVTALDPGDLWEANSTQIVPLLEKYGVQFE